jgi:16S rRNA (cytidine1402-2'-O)-methyltransferase
VRDLREDLERKEGTLYVVATPIGNLGDITARALEVLRQATLICAEDTRRTRALLSHFAITGKGLRALHAHSQETDVVNVVSVLRDGADVALVTDAGTPVVSDPGSALIAAAVAAGLTVVPIPGASAVLAALAGSGLGGDGFRFFGFLPRDGHARAERLATVAATPETAVLFEAPNRVQATLRELESFDPKRTCVVARELTKRHETFHRGTVAELATQGEWIGEVVLLLGPSTRREDERPDDAALDARIDEELGRGGHAKTVAERLAAWSGRPKRDVYERVILRKQR